jgi:alpha-amylase/alpha-mannosidase (GH57 family)
MPLANKRDALTQIRWGIADFEFRYGRKPEGMWLAETAVNRSVLDLMAQEGIKFTVLAPVQCARVRKIAANSSNIAADPPTAGASSSSSADAFLLSSRSAAEGSASSLSAVLSTEAIEAEEISWTETPNATVDPTHPYLIRLDEGRAIAVFFYDGPASRAIAFEGLLNSGEDFGNRLLAGFHPPSPDDPESAQISHVATDGESYGHHHKHGEMALSYAMHYIEDGHRARLTNYAEFLQKFPPKWEAEVVEDTSWSCAHGIERWRSNCGCNSGGKPGWNQEWRTPLREALDYLREATAPLAEQLAQPLLKDLWAARDAYIQVILDRSPASILNFFHQQATRELTEAERIACLELLELERHTQLMYTSCGWFFDEISGIETVQIIAYAGRVLQLARKLFGEPGAALEKGFLDILAKAKSNIPEIGDGAEVYHRYVNSMQIGLEQVGAHYAISSIFRNYPEHGELFCFDVHRESQETFNSGRGRVAVGRALIYSRITEENEDICFAVLHLGDQNLSAAVKRYNALDPAEVEAFHTFSTEIGTAIRRANLPEVIRLIDRFFGQGEANGESTAYSLTSLFADEQHRILNTILNQTISEMEDSLRKIYEDHASLLHFLTETGMSAPPALASAARFAINASLRRAIEAENFDPADIESLLGRAEADQIPLDSQLLGFTAGQRMKRAMVRLEASAAGDPSANGALATALLIAETIHRMPFEVNLWQAQNIWNDLLRRSDTNYWTAEWKEDFKKLGKVMNISVDELVIEEGVSAF